MALGQKKGQEKKSTESPEKKYVNIMQVCMGKGFDGQPPKEYVRGCNYKGRLLWQEFGGENGDDEANSTFYEIKTAFIGEPMKGSPEFILQNIVVNLANDKAAVKMNQE